MSRINISGIFNKKISFYGIFMIILMILFVTTAGKASAKANFTAINYMVTGDGTGIRNLKLEPIFSFDNINDVRLALIYNGYSFNGEGSWLVKFMDDKNYELNLVIKLGLAVADTSTFKKALGVAGKGFYLTNNRYFWEMKYLTDSQDWILQGGIGLPVSDSTDLTLGLGNSIWHPDGYLLHMGFAVEL